ncbi:MAG TPA: CYTH domain-containing protein [Roseiflexaceae bacterium]|jgi:inorganic triphosphatase YgiF|nr:CYTH domain-containing protein [Roseiflexaceae bacterium]
MEIEAKFVVPDATMFSAVLQLEQLGAFRLVAEMEPEQQHNIYFDTADGRLRAQRHGLRVRDLGDRRIATLKGAAHVHDGVYERDEWEVEVGDSNQPGDWPAGEVRDRVLALADGAPLAPILMIDTQRHHLYAWHEQRRVAEISVDEGTIHAGGRAEPFRELEVELLDAGTRAEFDALVSALRGHFALVPEERSKLARGLALLDGSKPSPL